ncbi:FtsX-like permease family protein [Listeria sp. FSL L7-1582]|uniref:FtsX-like permease family protein n=1 Tax=Listeria portnoyi TaxID=2713504 RepID=UPI00164D1DDE|nr:FtsX-like permease family protein [Listeria portnoyi]MBC6310545.1 FtsX-like permease family protein [Listeria portnoyi]
MTLFNIAFTNMRKNFGQFSMYLGSLILSVLIYFTFVSLAYTKSIGVIFDKWQIGGQGVFMAAAIVLILFVAFFVFYSSNYFTRSRKRELGLYSLLGLRKAQIGRIIFYENLMMHVVAVVSGIVIGVFFSKFFSMLLFRIMDLSIDSGFTFSVSAILSTMLVFGIILIVTTANGYWIVYRHSMVELFKADVREKNPAKGSLTLSIVGVLLIGFGYFLATRPIEDSIFWTENFFFASMLFVLFGVILGTWLVLRFLFPYIVYKLFLRKSFFYSGTNILTLTWLRYRMKKTAGTLTMIAVLSATTLTIIGTLSSFYTNIISFAESSNPNSYQTAWSTETEREEILEAIRESKSHTLVYHEAVDVFKGEVIDKVDESIPYRDQRMSQFSVMGLSDYNRLATKLDNDSKRIKYLADGKAIFLSPVGGFENKQRADLWMKDPYMVTFKNNPVKYSLEIKAVYNHEVFNTDMVSSTLVVNDRIYREISQKTMPKHIDIFQVTNEDRAEVLDHRIQKIIGGNPYMYNLSMSSFYSNYHMMSTLIGVILYIGMFIGIVFFAATGSIIYFKQITEAVDEKPRFEVLQKLGMSQKEVRSVIAKQVLPVFLIPLILGICHSVAALIGLSVNLLYSVGAPVMISTTIYTVFFIVYYFVCVNTYTKMVASGDD